eukprot:g3693.t1
MVTFIWKGFADSICYNLDSSVDVLQLNVLSYFLPYCYMTDLYVLLELFISRVVSSDCGGGKIRKIRIMQCIINICYVIESLNRQKNEIDNLNIETLQALFQGKESSLTEFNPFEIENATKECIYSSFNATKAFDWLSSNSTLHPKVKAIVDKYKKKLCNVLENGIENFKNNIESATYFWACSRLYTMFSDSFISYRGKKETKISSILSRFLPSIQNKIENKNTEFEKSIKSLALLASAVERNWTVNEKHLLTIELALVLLHPYLENCNLNSTNLINTLEAVATTVLKILHKKTEMKIGTIVSAAMQTGYQVNSKREGEKYLKLPTSNFSDSNFDLILFHLSWIYITSRVDILTILQRIIVLCLNQIRICSDSHKSIFKISRNFLASISIDTHLPVIAKEIVSDLASGDFTHYKIMKWRHVFHLAYQQIMNVDWLQFHSIAMNGFTFISTILHSPQLSHLLIENENKRGANDGIFQCIIGIIITKNYNVTKELKETALLLFYEFCTASWWCSRFSSQIMKNPFHKMGRSEAVVDGIKKNFKLYLPKSGRDVQNLFLSFLVSLQVSCLEEVFTVLFTLASSSNYLALQCLFVLLASDVHSVSQDENLESTYTTLQQRCINSVFVQVAKRIGNPISSENINIMRCFYRHLLYFFTTIEKENNDKILQLFLNGQKALLKVKSKDRFISLSLVFFEIFECIFVASGRSFNLYIERNILSRNRPHQFQSLQLVKDDEEIYGCDEKCSRAIFDNRFICQHWYHCYTCNLTNEKGCCSVCAKTCHKGHDVVYARKSRFFCDCAVQSCRKKSYRVNENGKEKYEDKCEVEKLPSFLSIGNILKSKQELRSILFDSIQRIQKIMLAKLINEREYSEQSIIMEKNVAKIEMNQDSNFSLQAFVCNTAFAIAIETEHPMHCYIAADSRGRSAVIENKTSIHLFNVLPLIFNRGKKEGCVVPFRFKKNQLKTMLITSLPFEMKSIMFHPWTDNIITVTGDNMYSHLFLNEDSSVKKKIIFQPIEETNTILSIVWIPSKLMNFAVISNTCIKILNLHNTVLQLLEWNDGNELTVIRDVQFVNHEYFFIATSHGIFVHHYNCRSSSNRSNYIFSESDRFVLPKNVVQIIGENASFSNILFVSLDRYDGFTFPRMEEAHDDKASFSGLLYFSTTELHTGILLVDKSLRMAIAGIMLPNISEIFYSKEIISNLSSRWTYFNNDSHPIALYRASNFSASNVVAVEIIDGNIKINAMKCNSRGLCVVSRDMARKSGATILSIEEDGRIFAFTRSPKEKSDFLEKVDNSFYNLSISPSLRIEKRKFGSKLEFEKGDVGDFENYYNVANDRILSNEICINIDDENCSFEVEKIQKHLFGEKFLKELDVSSEESCLKVVLSTCSPNMMICGIRLLLGATSKDIIPGEIRIGGRNRGGGSGRGGEGAVNQCGGGVNRRSGWFDFPLDLVDQYEAVCNGGILIEIDRYPGQPKTTSIKRIEVFVQERIELFMQERGGKEAEEESDDKLRYENLVLSTSQLVCDMLRSTATKMNRSEMEILGRFLIFSKFSKQILSLLNDDEMQIVTTCQTNALSELWREWQKNHQFSPQFIQRFASMSLNIPNEIIEKCIERAYNFCIEKYNFINLQNLFKNIMFVVLPSIKESEQCIEKVIQFLSCTVIDVSSNMAIIIAEMLAIATNEVPETVTSKENYKRCQTCYRSLYKWRSWQCEECSYIVCEQCHINSEICFDPKKSHNYTHTLQLKKNVGRVCSGASLWEESKSFVEVSEYCNTFELFFTKLISHLGKTTIKIETTPLLFVLFHLVKKRTSRAEELFLVLLSKFEKISMVEEVEEESNFLLISSIRILIQIAPAIVNLNYGKQLINVLMNDCRRRSEGGTTQGSDKVWERRKIEFMSILSIFFPKNEVYLARGRPENLFKQNRATIESTLDCGITVCNAMNHNEVKLSDSLEEKVIKTLITLIIEGKEGSRDVVEEKAKIILFLLLGGDRKCAIKAFDDAMFRHYLGMARKAEQSEASDRNTRVVVGRKDYYQSRVQICNSFTQLYNELKNNKIRMQNWSYFLGQSDETLKTILQIALKFKAERKIALNALELIRIGTSCLSGKDDGLSFFHRNGWEILIYCTRIFVIDAGSDEGVRNVMLQILIQVGCKELAFALSSIIQYCIGRRGAKLLDAISSMYDVDVQKYKKRRIVGEIVEEETILARSIAYKFKDCLKDLGFPSKDSLMCSACQVGVANDASNNGESSELLSLNESNAHFNWDVDSTLIHLKKAMKIEEVLVTMLESGRIESKRMPSKVTVYILEDAGDGPKRGCSKEIEASWEEVGSRGVGGLSGVGVATSWKEVGKITLKVSLPLPVLATHLKIKFSEFRTTEVERGLMKMRCPSCLRLLNTLTHATCVITGLEKIDGLVDNLFFFAAEQHGVVFDVCKQGGKSGRSGQSERGGPSIMMERTCSSRDLYFIQLVGKLANGSEIFCKQICRTLMNNDTNISLLQPLCTLKNASKQLINCLVRKIIFGAEKIRKVEQSGDVVGVLITLLDTLASVVLTKREVLHSFSCAFGMWRRFKWRVGRRQGNTLGLEPSFLALIFYLPMLLLSKYSNVRFATGSIIQIVAKDAPIGVCDLLLLALRKYTRFCNATVLVKEVLSILQVDIAKQYILPKGLLSHVAELLRKESSELRKLEVSEDGMSRVNEEDWQSLESFARLYESVSSRNSKAEQSGAVVDVLHVVMYLRALELQRTASTIRAEKVLMKLMSNHSTEWRRQRIVELGRVLRRVGEVAQEYDFDDRVRLCCLRQINQEIKPKVKEKEYLVAFKCAPTQDDYFPRSLKKERKVKNLKLRDLRKLIAIELDLIDAEALIEFIVCGSIISMDLYLKDVFENWWKRRDGGEIMDITYRLAGVDGEATEDRIESFESGENWKEGVTYEVTTSLDFETLLEETEKIVSKNNVFSSLFCKEMIDIFQFSLKRKENVKYLQNINAGEVLVQIYGVGVQNNMERRIRVELLLIIECIINKCNPKFLLKLLGSKSEEGDAVETIEQEEKRIIARCLPKIIKGRSEAKEIVNFLTSTLDCNCVGDEHLEEERRNILLECLENSGNLIKDILLENGITEQFIDELLLEDVPKIVIRIILKIAKNHKQTQKLLLEKGVIEKLFDMEEILAEDILEILLNSEVKAVRERVEKEKKRICEDKKEKMEAKRSEVLQSMGLVRRRGSEQLLFSQNSEWLSSGEEEEGCRCVVCGESSGELFMYCLRTREVERSGVEQNRTKSCDFLKTTSAANCIHLKCHSRGGTGEWEEAEKLNGMAKCNVLMPLEGHSDRFWKVGKVIEVERRKTVLIKDIKSVMERVRIKGDKAKPSENDVKLLLGMIRIGLHTWGEDAFVDELGWMGTFLSQKIKKGESEKRIVEALKKGGGILDDLVEFLNTGK